MILKKIISGGQTGADYTGLVVAKENGLETGGHCPKGCRTDVGPRLELVSHFGLVETFSEGYIERTHLNAFNSDGTVWFGHTDSPGYYCTLNGLKKAKKKIIENPTPKELAEWIIKNNISILNVAGNRQRTNPNVVTQTRFTLSHTIKLLKGAEVGLNPKTNI